MKRKIRNQMVIYCESKEELKDLFQYLENNHYTWKSGKKCFVNDIHNVSFYEDKDICYHLNSNNLLSYGTKQFFEKMELPIVNFSDLDIPKMTE